MPIHRLHDVTHNGTCIYMLLAESESAIKPLREKRGRREYLEDDNEDMGIDEDLDTGASGGSISRPLRDKRGRRIHVEDDDEDLGLDVDASEDRDEYQKTG